MEQTESSLVRLINTGRLCYRIIKLTRREPIARQCDIDGGFDFHFHFSLIET